jgi:hypothetical protein
MNKYGELTKQERRAAAVELLDSMRGRYIMGQALALAHRQLAENEPSNAADMELFGREFFDPWFSAALLVTEPALNWRTA